MRLAGSVRDLRRDERMPVGRIDVRRGNRDEDEHRDKLYEHHHRIESARFNTVMVFVKLVAVLIFIAVAAPHVNPANWHPFIPPQVTDAAGQSHFGLGGILTGASLIFFAYIGFDAVSTAAEETVNPQRNLPIGIIASLVICTVLYIVVSGILTGVVHYDQIDVKAPIADALKQLGIGWAEAMVSIGALA